MLENVEEFKTWGPLNRSHRPIKSKQGETFKKFVEQLTDLGYKVQFRELIPAALVKSNLPELCKAKRQPNFRTDRVSEEKNGQLRFV